MSAKGPSRSETGLDETDSLVDGVDCGRRQTTISLGSGLETGRIAGVDSSTISVPVRGSLDGLAGAESSSPEAFDGRFDGPFD